MCVPPGPALRPAQSLGTRSLSSAGLSLPLSTYLPHALCREIHASSLSKVFPPQELSRTAAGSQLHVCACPSLSTPVGAGGAVLHRKA